MYPGPRHERRIFRLWVTILVLVFVFVVYVLAGGPTP